MTGAPAAAARLGPLLDRPLVVVDAGARWGVSPTWAWFGEHARVTGFEPDPEEAARLAERYAADPSTEVLPVALGRSPGRLPLYVTEDASGSSLLPPLPLRRFGNHLVGDQFVGVVEVEVTTVDAWAATSASGPVDAIKLDVQGGEVQVLEGAAAALADVRMVLAEVHLNPMYEGAPLFGDVDALLRRHGFELWRFPVVAHYASAVAARHMVDRVDVHWYGQWATPVEAAPGQLLWADALFIKRDLASPGVAPDPVRLVRDAALAIGLEEPDLATSGLALALDVAPTGWRPALEAALDALRHRSPTKAFATSRRQHLADTAHDLDGPLDVDLALPITGWGWHDPEPAGDRWLRWTGPPREATLDLALRLPPGTEVCVTLAGAADAELLGALVVEVDGQQLGTVAAWDGQAVHHRGTTGPRWARGYTRLTLRTGRTVPWSELHPGSGDDTEYGVAVGGISFRPPTSGGDGPEAP